MTKKPIILFGPEARVMTLVMNEILSAGETIDIESFLISSKRIANRIVSAHEKGVKIRMIIDWRLARKWRSKHRFLMKKGVYVKTFKVRHGYMHNKFLVIDGKKVIAGSPNLSNDANYRSFEFIMVSEDQDVVAPFADRFNEMWNMRQAIGLRPASPR